MNIKYNGWELKYFDNAINFRKYQLELIQSSIRGHVAEIGPGNGVIASKYKLLVKRVDLYEPTDLICKNLKKKFKNSNNVSIFNKTLNTKKKYDTIIYLDVIEHIKQDKKEVKKALNNLKKNGVLIINVPAFNFLYSEFDEDVGHYKRYDQADFKVMLKSTKNISYKMKYYDSIGFLLSFFNKFIPNGRKKFMKRKILFWDSLMILSKFIDSITLNSFGKSLLIFIKKK